MREGDVAAWFADYVSAFAAMGRSETPPEALVPRYAVPLLLTTDDVAASLGSPEEVGAWLQSQVESMAAAGYDHTQTLAGDVEVLNQTTAVHRGEFSRRRADGSEINRMSVTYLLTRPSGELRIAALVLHSS